MKKGPNQKKKKDKIKKDKGCIPPIISAKFQQAVTSIGSLTSQWTELNYVATPAFKKGW